MLCSAVLMTIIIACIEKDTEYTILKSSLAPIYRNKAFA